MGGWRQCVIVLWCVLLSACSGPPGQPVPPGSEVIAFGDSVTAGAGAGKGEDYPTLLAARTGWKVINAGVPGDTAEAGRARLPEVLRGQRPALVIIEIGGNDFLRRSPPERVKQHIRELISIARGSGAQLVLVGVPAPSVFGAVTGSLDDAPLYAELAEEEDIPLIEGVFSDVLSQPELRADAIHPNARGYERMVSGMLEALREQGLLAH